MLKLILDAKDSPVDSVIDFSDIEDVDLSQIDGIYTGITELDNKLMKMFYGTVTILTGTNGSGKSSLLSQFICQSLDQQKSVWLYSKELPNSMMKNWIDFIFAGRHNIDQFHVFLHHTFCFGHMTRVPLKIHSLFLLPSVYHGQYLIPTFPMIFVLLIFPTLALLESSLLL